MDAVTGSLDNITEHTGDDRSPAYSPSGTRIAFASNRDGDYEIYTMNPDGTGVVKRTFNTSSDLAPSWSPDGSNLAFVSGRDGNFEIYTMNANGTSQTRRTNNTTTEEYPHGRKLNIVRRTSQTST